MIETFCTGSTPGQGRCDKRMAHFVIGDAAALRGDNIAALLLDPGNDVFDCGHEVREGAVRHSRRVATTAASLTRLARSAPVKPVVRAGDAIEIASDREEIFFRYAPSRWQAGPAIGPIDQHLTVEAAGPERAGSSISGRLVAASKMTPVEGSKPSSSARKRDRASAPSRRGRRSRPLAASGQERRARR